MVSFLTYKIHIDSLHGWETRKKKKEGGWGKKKESVMQILFKTVTRGWNILYNLVPLRMNGSDGQKKVGRSPFFPPATEKKQQKLERNHGCISSSAPTAYRFGRVIWITEPCRLDVCDHSLPGIVDPFHAFLSHPHLIPPTTKTNDKNIDNPSPSAPQPDFTTFPVFQCVCGKLDNSQGSMRHEPETCPANAVSINTQ